MTRPPEPGKAIHRDPSEQPPTEAEPHQGRLAIPETASRRGEESGRHTSSDRLSISDQLDDDQRSRENVEGRFLSETVLADRYRIGELLGRGGIGEVYRAEDLTLNESVALKLLLERRERDLRRQAVFLDEVRGARRVTHPNVCRVHDVGETDDGLLFLSMEYIEGEDLASLLARRGRLPAGLAIEIGIQVAEGLSAIHERKLLHLDLKPSNLMLDSDGRVKITDFGLVARPGDRARGGTFRYMPPEQISERVSAASDIYSLGLVLYELVTGQPAFLGRSRSLLERLHRDALPTPPSQVVSGVALSLERLILHCLEKRPTARPKSAEAVAETLHGIRSEELIEIPSNLRSDESVSLTSEDFTPPSVTTSGLLTWPPLDLPEQPYPLLFPYRHPALLAGRDRELSKLSRMLRRRIPILGLRAVSGTGKSSLLLGGLVPSLRSAGAPVAYDRHPWEPGLGRRLLAELVEVDAFDEIGGEGIAQRLREVRQLAGRPPVLVVDQFEEVLKRREVGALAVLGRLLAATVGLHQGLDDPPCRWLLAYREEYHGEVVTWLDNVLAEAQREGLEGLDGLPWELSGADRFQIMSLPPLGTPVAGSSGIDTAKESFLAAIETPLGLVDAAGTPRYPWRFAPGHAERLAMAFAETRLEQPDAPLLPELQVILAHLLSQTPGNTGEDSIEIRVPEEPSALIDEALGSHLRRSLEAAFAAAGVDASRERSRALLALRELARSTGRKNEGLPADVLAEAIGEGGDAVLQRLAAADTRLIVAHEAADGLRWVLSHDRLSEAVVRLFEEDWRHGRLGVDSELLSLRHFVTLESALFGLRGGDANRVPRSYFRRIEENSAALLWDDSRREWWAACWRRRRADRLRWVTRGVAASLVLAVTLFAVWSWADQRTQHQGLIRQVSSGEPSAALVAFDKLARRADADPAALLDLLRTRPSPTDVIERGLGGLALKERGTSVLRLVELLLPLVAERPEDPVRVAGLVWALDFTAAADPGLEQKALALRQQVLAPLYRLRPPLSDVSLLGDWVELPAGSFSMGSDGQGTEVHESPVHVVALGSFRLLDHEITAAEYRLFDPEYEGEGDLPAAFVTWHDAYTYSAWLGGRLPTEAEWEYAARAGCEFEYCTALGTKGRADQVAWILKNSRQPETQEPKRQPPRQLEANPWGLYDMLGNLWEWTADGYAPYQTEPSSDPWVLASSEGGQRLLRGGCVRDQPDLTRVSYRNPTAPEHNVINNGFRPMLPSIGR